MVVTFVDGVVVEYPNVRFSINRIATDPTKVNGTTVTIEDDEQEITLCGVRSFKMEHGL